jgi:hypothetical protein
LGPSTLLLKSDLKLCEVEMTNVTREPYDLSASGAQVLLIESGGPDDAPTIANPSVRFYNLGGPLDYHLPIMAATILARRKSYYEALEGANKENEITRWLMWFAGVAIEAQRRTVALVEFLIDKTKLLDQLKGQLNARQEKALLRMFREGPEGFKGGLPAGKYSTITGASPATTTRDLADLVSRERGTRTRRRTPLRPLSPEYSPAASTTAQAHRTRRVDGQIGALQPGKPSRSSRRSALRNCRFCCRITCAPKTRSGRSQFRSWHSFSGRSNLKPLTRDGSQFTCVPLHPDIDGGIPLDSAVESQQFRSHRRSTFCFRDLWLHSTLTRLFGGPG